MTSKWAQKKVDMGDSGIPYEYQERMISYLRICIEILVDKGYMKSPSPDDFTIASRKYDASDFHILNLNQFLAHDAISADIIEIPLIAECTGVYHRYSSEDIPTVQNSSSPVVELFSL
ncbi:uncharacterized protein EAF02_009433 [Botrytis sinoallii]|uniref:uncharacterized protein n=1 Tax=Botrytis sinoallii TaxID=1463999 RepID=UPI0019028989|nr:uncharacterized protein EAF02_009433 [Botrytis sinoallii]KAF7870243.1 hypothetical protein EAF02_009433 [Botrytis sinoallii]